MENMDFVFTSASFDRRLKYLPQKNYKLEIYELRTGLLVYNSSGITDIKKHFGDYTFSSTFYLPRLFRQQVVECFSNCMKISDSQTTLFPCTFRDGVISKDHTAKAITFSQDTGSRTFSSSTITSTTNTPQVVTGPCKRLFDGKAYIKDVGWCIQQKQPNVFLFLFNDGVELLVDGNRNTVHYKKADLISNELAINRYLPVHVKQKLSYFSDFVQMLL